VQLLGSRAEPATVRIRERRWSLELLEAEQQVQEV
jgi:hypothetical protein